MNKYLQPKTLYLWALVYLASTVLLHWRLKFETETIIYAIGAVVGLHLFKFTEAAVNVTPSPLRNLLTLALVTVLTMFILTSTTLPLGKGVVLFLNLHLFYLIFAEYRAKRSLPTWLSAVPEARHRFYYLLFGTVFIFETTLFILV